LALRAAVRSAADEVKNADSIPARARLQRAEKELAALVAGGGKKLKGQQRDQLRGAAKKLADAREAQQQAAAAAQESRAERLKRLLTAGGLAGPDTAVGQDFRAAFREERRLREVLHKLEASSARIAARRKKIRWTSASAEHRSESAALADEHLRLRLQSEQVRDELQKARRVLSTSEAEILHQDDLRREAAETHIRASRLMATCLNWRVLPRGRVAMRARGLGESRSGNGSRDGGRIEFLDSLTPLQWYEGSHLGETIYLVAEFPSVAIADTQDYGNALYYCLPSQGDWRRIFQLDKQEARRAGARRLVHTGDWRERVRRLVRSS